MPHAPDDAPPRRKRPPAPPPRVPVHDTPPPRHSAPPPPPTRAQQGVAAMLGHHAPDDAPPTRTPPHHASPGIVQQQTPFTHDTPPHPPTPTYGPGRISRPTSTNDRILAVGKGPLNAVEPGGKIDIPQASHARPSLPTVPQFQPPAQGTHRAASPQELSRAHAAIAASDARYADQPQAIRDIEHKRAVQMSLLPLGDVQLPTKDISSLWQALSNLPIEDRARVISSLPGVDKDTLSFIDYIRDHTRPSGTSGLVNNFFTDALHTPQGVALGLVQTARAVASALPSASIGPGGANVQQGNYEPIRQVAGATISPYTSWSNFKHSTYEHPFQALLALSGAGRAVGAAAGVAGRAGLLGDAARAGLSGNAARTITEGVGTRTLPGGERAGIGRTHNVGTYDRNALVNLLQRGSDAAASAQPTAWRIGANARIGRIGEDLARTARTAEDISARDRTGPVINASRRVSRPERTAAIYSQGTRIKPSEWVSHYQQEVTSLEQRLAESKGARTGDKVARADISRRLDTARSALKTWKKVYKKTGDVLTPRAQKLALAARKGAQSREQQFLAEDMLTPEQAASRIEQPSSVITGEPRPGGFFTHADIVDRGPDRGTRSRGAGAGNVSSLKHSTGEAFRSGNVDFGMMPFLRSLAEPDQILHAKRQLEEVKRLGTRVEPGDKIGADQILVRVKTRLGDREGPFTPSSLVSRNTKDADTVPPGNWLAVNKRAIKPLQSRLDRPEPGTSTKIARAATQAFKWQVLMTRPAWLASNVVGNTAQALLAGTGPVSAYRALDRSGRVGKHLPGRDYRGVIPVNAQNAGFAARMLAPKRGLLPRSDRLPENPLVRANVTNENWLRRATYLRHAIGTPLGRKLGITTKDIDSLTARKTAEERAPQLVKVVDRFLGNFAKHSYAEGATIAIPFIRWFEFIGKQTLLDLPLHHPARALLLYRLGTLGNIASEQAFGLPNQSIDGGIPLPGTHGTSQGDPVSWVLRTGSLNPWATISQLGGFESTDPRQQPSYSGAFSALNPFAQAIYNTVKGREFSNPEYPTTRDNNAATRAAYFGNELYGMAPIARLAFGNQRWGQSPQNPISQPTADFWLRLLGYNLAGISPVDVPLMNAKNLRTLMGNE